MFGSNRRATDEVQASALVLRRIETSATLVIPRPREVVSAAIDAHVADETGSSGRFSIVGAPETGLGSRRLAIGPPMPPFGLRTIMHTEVIAVEPGHWRTTQMISGTAEQTETLLLADIDGGHTLATVNGWMSKIMRSDDDGQQLRALLTDPAARWLEPIRASAGSEGHDAGPVA